MNVMLTGNGFDLAHHLPTRYIDFINIAEELQALKNINNCKWVAFIMGKKSKLYERDEWIKTCCDSHNGFARIEVNSDKMKKLMEGTRNNIWIKFFINYKDGNIGWIDFEKELEEALNILSYAITEIDKDIENNQIFREKLRADQYSKLIFFKEIFEEDSITKNRIFIKDKYLRITSNGEPYKVNIDKISTYLSKELNDLIELLNIYFEEIINKITKNKDFVKTYNQIEKIKNIDYQINFNYTNTLETLYSIDNENVCYVHGKANSNGNSIILGTRDNNDINTDIFYNFRKYYQCIQKCSDFNYRKLLIPKSSNTYYVWGHSLDNTDGDILHEIFTNSLDDKFIIFYHKEESRDELIKNLIKLLKKDTYQKYWHSNKITFEKIIEGD